MAKKGNYCGDAVVATTTAHGAVAVGATTAPVAPIATIFCKPFYN